MLLLPVLTQDPLGVDWRPSAPVVLNPLPDGEEITRQLGLARAQGPSLQPLAAEVALQPEGLSHVGAGPSHADVGQPENAVQENAVLAGLELEVQVLANNFPAPRPPHDPGMMSHDPLMFLTQANY